MRLATRLALLWWAIAGGRGPRPHDHCSCATCAAACEDCGIYRSIRLHLGEPTGAIEDSHPWGLPFTRGAASK
jgi:hypothetical protein